MPRPTRDLAPDARLHHEVAALLRGQNAHVDAATALRGIPPERANERVDGMPHSLWDLVEHLRIAQADILEFSRSADYQAKDWPADYWPDGDATLEAWSTSRDAFLADLDALIALAEDDATDLTAEFAWAPGYTLLRQLLLVADHNAHHLGQIVSLRRQLGLWPPEDKVEADLPEAVRPDGPA